jgi:co-chaperonin GroES (HSP10)
VEPIFKDKTESGIILPEGTQKLPLGRVYDPGNQTWLSKGDMIVIDSNDKGKAIFEIGDLKIIRLFPDEILCVIESAQ